MNNHFFFCVFAFWYLYCALRLLTTLQPDSPFIPSTHFSSHFMLFICEVQFGFLFFQFYWNIILIINAHNTVISHNKVILSVPMGKLTVFSTLYISPMTIVFLQTEACSNVPPFLSSSNHPPLLVTNQCSHLTLLCVYLLCLSSPIIKESVAFVFISTISLRSMMTLFIYVSRMARFHCFA